MPRSQRRVGDLEQPMVSPKCRQDESQKKILVACFVISITFCLAIIASSLLIYRNTVKLDKSEIMSLQFEDKLKALKELNISFQGASVEFSKTVEYTLTDVRHHQKIPFAYSHTNIEQAYHPETSVFSCHRSGKYTFLLAILLYPTSRIDIQIVKEGDWLANFYTKGDENQEYGSGSISVTARLQKGDKVWIRVFGNRHTGNAIIKVFPFLVDSA